MLEKIPISRAETERTTVYLIDTNILSESRKGKDANPSVLRFWESAGAEDCYISVQTIGEIRKGLESIRSRGDVDQASRLEIWLNLLTSEYADRMIDFDRDCAHIWGILSALHPQNPIDKQIAAIALIHSLTVVTCNVKDFSGTGVNLLNPFI